MATRLDAKTGHPIQKCETFVSSRNREGDVDAKHG